MRPPHTQIIIFHNEPPFHSCIYYIVIDDEYQKIKLITSSSNSDLSVSYYTTTKPPFQSKSLTSPIIQGLTPPLVCSAHTQLPQNAGCNRKQVR